MIKFKKFNIKGDKVTQITDVPSPVILACHLNDYIAYLFINMPCYKYVLDHDWFMCQSLVDSDYKAYLYIMQS